MTIETTTHLNFRGDARAALELYQSAFGGDVVIAKHADAGGTDPDLVAWGQVTTRAGFRIMAFDVWDHLPWEQGDHAFYVSVRGDDADELRGYWERLSEGATILQELAPAAWSPLYGQLTDRFGVTWVLDVAVAHEG
ncbi:VOC family protein [Aeromicrobium alkaliterrae]|uniref:VOC family protein n=1 Tax=Aeromicrobium alkaliterrae TaxID=302168 RepID=A0ABN2K5X6_9ACTN